MARGHHLLVAGLAGFAVAQFPPTPEGITYLQSQFHENVTISFKEPGLCETTPGVKSYAGYVHLPAGFLNDVSDIETQDYPINTFFWFFESRKDPLNAPLAIWLNGGPGGSSLMGLLQENGPCFVNPDSKTTYLNEWSWNNNVNLLYIDQPNQVGFSYDYAVNGTFVPGNGSYVVVPWDDKMEVPEPNLTTRHGTFASQNPLSTANTTALAAHALWHFAQTWFFEFPHYKPHDDRISLWAESYGGHYGPGIFDFFLKQNEKISKGDNNEKNAHYIHLDTLGIVNGLVDVVVQGESAITYPYNNSYGLEIFNKSLHDELLHNWTRPNGCKEQLKACQDSLEGHGLLFFERGIDNLADACESLSSECSATHAFWQYQDVVEPGAGWYDVTAPKADPFPPPYMQGYLTQEHVLAALGVPVNYSLSSQSVGSGFEGTHDMIHGGFLASLAHLLDAGVKVHMMYGDRDYPCNWVGGEAASLAVPYSQAAAFAAAGYAPFTVTASTADGNDDVVKGMTRQRGNFSFTRVFQAGHEVPAYEGQASWELFHRATFGLDVPTGKVVTDDAFATVGPSSVWNVKGVVPVPMKPRCYILAPMTCVPAVWEKVLAGAVIVKDWFVVEESDGDLLESSMMGVKQDLLDEL